MMSFSQIINDFIQSFSSINLGGNFKEIVTNPLTILTLIGVLIILVLLIKAKDIKFDAKMLTTIGIALALTAVLNMLKIYKFPQGGGITLGSMIPIILIAYAYGPLVGMLTGFLFGVIYLIISPYILHPIQVLFDYPLPFMAVGLAGYFKNKKLLGTFVGMFVRFIFHFISGFLFFGQFAPEGWSPMIYSLVANGLVVGANLIVVLIIIALLPINRIIKTSNNFTL